MPLDLSIIAASATLGSAFTILRSAGGQWVSGVWEDSNSPIAMFGPVTIASPKDLKMLPEGDRPEAAMLFWTTVPVYVTQGPPAGVNAQGFTSDIMVWNGLSYRILQVSERPMNGYYRAIATRMLGE